MTWCLTSEHRHFHYISAKQRYVAGWLIISNILRLNFSHFSLLNWISRTFLRNPIKRDRETYLRRWCPDLSRDWSSRALSLYNRLRINKHLALLRITPSFSFCPSLLPLLHLFLLPRLAVAAIQNGIGDVWLALQCCCRRCSILVRLFSCPLEKFVLSLIQMKLF